MKELNNVLGSDKRILMILIMIIYHKKYF